MAPFVKSGGGFVRAGGGFAATGGGFVATGGGFAAASPVAGVDTLLSIAVTFTGAQVTGSTFRPTVGTDRAQAVATGTYSISGAVDITTLVTWSSGTVGTATISNGAGTEGQCTAVSVGQIASGEGAQTSLITATLGISGNATLTVDTDRDSNGIRYPLNTFQYSLAGLTLAGSDDIYPCQEASGNLAGTGPGAITLTANATPLYQVNGPSGTRKGVGFNATANQRFTAGSGVGPSPASVDTTWTWIAAIPVLPAATRTLISAGTTTTVQQLTSGNLQKNIPGFTAVDSTTRPDVDDALHFLHHTHDITNSRAALYTDEAKTTITFATTTDNIKGIGGASSPDAGSVYTYGLRLTAANARAFSSDSGSKALGQWFGFTVPWT